MFLPTLAQVGGGCRCHTARDYCPTGGFQGARSSCAAVYEKSEGHTGKCDDLLLHVVRNCTGSLNQIASLLFFQIHASWQ